LGRPAAAVAALEPGWTVVPQIEVWIERLIVIDLDSALAVKHA